MEIKVNANNEENQTMSVTAKVNVTKNGIFTTRLSENDIRLIKSYHIKELELNPMKFTSDTLNGLYDQIHEILMLCLTCRIIEEKPVLRYYINTVCEYVLGDKGEIYPNGSYTETVKEFDTNWKSGTKVYNSIDTGDYGFSFWVCPYIKKTVQYGNGKSENVYDRFHGEDGTNMRWLEDMNQVAGFKSTIRSTEQKEIAGTEKNAAFFVNLMKSLCKLNENLKSVFNNSDNLQKLIDSNIKLLS